MLNNDRPQYMSRYQVSKNGQAHETHTDGVVPFLLRAEPTTTCTCQKSLLSGGSADCDGPLFLTFHFCNSTRVVSLLHLHWGLRTENRVLPNKVHRRLPLIDLAAAGKSLLSKFGSLISSIVLSPLSCNLCSVLCKTISLPFLCSVNLLIWKQPPWKTSSSIGKLTFFSPQRAFSPAQRNLVVVPIRQRWRGHVDYPSSL
jgi:hypothetical protein